MNWNRTVDESALAEGVPLEATAGERQVLLVMHSGQVYATDARCPHMGRHLKDGRVTEDGHIICPLHHSEFDLKTGEAVKWAPWPPGVGAVLGAVRQRRALMVYPTRISEGAVWVGTE